MSNDAGWSSLVARRAHNPKVAGSNPAPAMANISDRPPTVLVHSRGTVLSLVEHETRTVEVDAELLSRAREAMGSRSDLSEAEVIEQALRLVVGRHAMTTAQSVSRLTEDDAMSLAYKELDAMRKAKRRVS
jgi:hypothetical protein